MTGPWQIWHSHGQDDMTQTSQRVLKSGSDALCKSGIREFTESQCPIPRRRQARFGQGDVTLGMYLGPWGQAQRHAELILGGTDQLALPLQQ